MIVYRVQHRVQRFDLFVKVYFLCKFSMNNFKSLLIIWWAFIPSKYYIPFQETSRKWIPRSRSGVPKSRRLYAEHARIHVGIVEGFLHLSKSTNYRFLMFSKLQEVFRFSFISCCGNSTLPFQISEFFCSRHVNPDVLLKNCLYCSLD